MQKVNCWMHKTDSMGLDITSFDETKIPHFVYKVKAEPSSVKSCTPKPLRQRRLSYSSGVPRLINGFVTYDLSDERLEATPDRQDVNSPSRARAASYFGAPSPRMPQHHNGNNRAQSFDYTDHSRIIPARGVIPQVLGYDTVQFDTNNLIREDHPAIYTNAIANSPVRFLPPPPQMTSIIINPQDYMQQGYNSASPRYANKGPYFDNNYPTDYQGGERRRTSNGSYVVPPNSYPVDTSYQQHAARSKQVFPTQSSSSFRVLQSNSQDSTSTYYQPTQDLNKLNPPIIEQQPLLQENQHVDPNIEPPQLMFGSIAASHEVGQNVEDSFPQESHASTEVPTASSPKRTRKDLAATPPPDTNGNKKR